MNYAGCDVINDNFMLQDDGVLVLKFNGKVVDDHVMRAYIFANMFFYDAVDKEIKKIIEKVNAIKDRLLLDGNIDISSPEKIFAPLSLLVKGELRTSELDGFIKLELNKIKNNIALGLTENEKKQIEKIKEATFVTEFQKLKGEVILLGGDMYEPKEIQFKDRYFELLSSRGRRLFLVTVKVLGMLSEIKFTRLKLSESYKLSFLYSQEKIDFNEDEVKDKIKSFLSENLR
ncbi:MAG: hypothetical protein LBH47_00220 [Christensenellaceae bacterium]|jgi:hypothetical protein|nr:hypothetical protein [Christensenellaceae bacterium]